MQSKMWGGHVSPTLSIRGDGSKLGEDQCGAVSPMRGSAAQCGAATERLQKKVVDLEEELQRVGKDLEMKKQRADAATSAAEVTNIANAEKFRDLQKDVDAARFQAEETTAEVEKLTKEIARLVEEDADHVSKWREDVLRLETTYKEQLAEAEQRESDLRAEIASLEKDRAKFTTAEAKFQRSETELKILLKQQKAAAQKEQIAADKREKALQDKLAYTTREMETIKTRVDDTR